MLQNKSLTFSHTNFCFISVGQEPILCNSELFNAFLSIAQQETSGLVVENTSIDVFLMNGYKISLNIQTNERSDHILEVSCVINPAAPTVHLIFTKILKQISFYRKYVKN